MPSGQRSHVGKMQKGNWTEVQPSKIWKVIGFFVLTHCVGNLDKDHRISSYTHFSSYPFSLYSLYPPSSYTHCIPLLHILIVSPFFIYSLYPPSSYILPSSYTHCIPLLHILIVSPFFIIYTHCYSRVVV